jgi:serine protease Do
MPHKNKATRLNPYLLLIIGILAGLLIASYLRFVPSIPLFQPPRTVYADDMSTDITAQLAHLQNSFRFVAKSVLPVVVMVSTVDVREQLIPEDDSLPWFYYFFEDPEAEEGSQGRGYRTQGLGSGVIVDREGDTYYILTNNHVIELADEIQIVLHNGEEFPGKFIAADERKDLAIIEFQSRDKDIPIAVLGDSDTLEVGDWVLAIGNPYGFDSSVTAGIVSALGRRGGPSGNINEFIQTDASINSGNSGGAMINLAGEVVGINTWITSPTGGSIGLGFAIPINNAKKVVKDIIKTGSIQNGWLGVSLAINNSTQMEAIITEMSDKSTEGALVFQVLKDSPAYEAGIVPGDIITAINGVEAGSADAVTRIIGELSPGDSIDLSTYRSGKQYTFTARIEKRKPTDELSKLIKDWWPGFIAATAKENEGVEIVDVTQKTPAYEAGLRSGDIIAHINGQETATVADFYRAIQVNEGALLSCTVVRNNTTSQIEFTK